LDLSRPEPPEPVRGRRIGTLREIYAPDAVIWHNDDLEQPVEHNLKVLQGLHRAVSGLRYDIVRPATARSGQRPAGQNAQWC
jgi:hypothetical protein